MPSTLDMQLRSKLILIACLIAISCLMTPKVFSQAADIKTELRQRFHNKTFLIEGWYQDENLTYDSSGVVIGTPQRGSWTTSAGKIRSIKVRRNDFVLKGYRGGFAYDLNSRKFGAIIVDKLELTITIRADPATLTAANLDNLQHAIFAQNARLNEMPEYWRDFMAHGERDPKKDVADANNKGEVVAGLQSNAQPVFRVGNGVTPPRMLKHDEPEFTDMARKTHYQGTVVLSSVVDDQGVPTQIKIMRALGMGLDEAAVISLEKWRFAPARRDDKPVAVTVDIEVNFRLY